MGEEHDDDVDQNPVGEEGFGVKLFFPLQTHEVDDVPEHCRVEEDLEWFYQTFVLGSDDAVGVWLAISSDITFSEYDNEIWNEMLY